MSDKPTEIDLFVALPKPPADAVFKLDRVETRSIPHPYYITSKHVCYASDHCGGMLDIEQAEKNGARCGMRDCRLKYDEHESGFIVFISVPAQYQADLNNCPGLHQYLMECKPVAEQFKAIGFAFPSL